MESSVFGRIVIAIIVGVFFTIILGIVGGLLATLGVSWATILGEDMEKYAGILGLLVALWYFFSGYSQAPNWLKRR
jgi:hypothetical protein